MVRGRIPLAGFCLVSLSLAGCGDDAIGPSGQPSRVIVSSGGTQNGPVGQPLGAPIEVQVLDAAGNPVPSVRVIFELDPAAGTLSHDTVISSNQGKAATSWTLPLTAGTYTARARVAQIDTAEFTATAVPGGPGLVILVSSDSQTALVGEVVSRAVSVVVKDAYGNAVSGETVSFSIGSGGESLSDYLVLTDANGAASTNWTWGSAAGVHTVFISTGSLGAVQVTGLRFPALAPERLSVATRHGCWLDPGGTAFCWGGNAVGQLGDGTITTRYQPVAVTGGHLFRSISTSSHSLNSTDYSMTCGSTSTDSTVFCWGFGPVSSSTPMILAGAPKLVSVTVGESFGCGLGSDSLAYCWGSNTYGQLGDGTSLTHDLPAPVTGNLRFRQVAAGARHVCGVTRTGDLYCWGENLNAQIGNGTRGTTNVPTPVLVGGQVRFASVRSGRVHNCALALDGGLYCWGNDGRGEVTASNGTSLWVLQPTLVTTGLALSNIGLGFEHTCGLVVDGTGFCWGRNYEFGLGDSTYGERATPAPILGGHQFSLVDGDIYGTCGISTADELFCWGINHSGVVGVPDSTQQLTSVAVLGGHTYATIATGLWHSCALTPSGDAYCWGQNMQWGELGDGTNNPRASPQAVSGGHVFTSLDAGGYSTCGVDNAGQAFCWGRGLDGEIGDGAFTDTNIPTPVAGNHTFTSISVGWEQACGLTAAGQAWCWGAADGQGTPYGLPVPVTSPESFTQVSAGWRHTCALGTSGTAYCWFPRADSVSPTAVSPGGPPFTQIQAGLYDACALAAGGTAYCWGIDQPSPTPVSGGLSFTSLAHSYVTFCGVTTTNLAYCWGNNDYGQLGIGQTGGFYPDPTPVLGGLMFSRLSPEAFLTCGLDLAGSAYCWGLGQYGGLGNGATLAKPQPIRIQ